jgi:hypothetical protein
MPSRQEFAQFLIIPSSQIKEQEAQIAMSGILQDLERYCGPERFGKFVAALNGRCKISGRLLFWQERLLEDFEAHTGTKVPIDLEGVLKLFRRPSVIAPCPSAPGMEINLDKVREALGYAHVREISREGLLYYEIDPLDSTWPRAYLVLSRDPETGKLDVLQAGFGDWHTHFERYRNPDRNIRAALAVLKNIVSGVSSVITFCNARGKSIGSRLVASADLQVNLPPPENAVSMKSFIFNRPPALPDRIDSQ